jgi:hypothetical protein
MATRYTKTQIKTLISDNSDHNDPDCRSTFTAVTNSVTEGLAYVVQAATGGTTVDLTNFTTLNEVILHNTDTTNFVTLLFSADNGNISGATLRIPAGAQVCLTDVDPASTFTLTADTAAVCVDLMAWGD